MKKYSIITGIVLLTLATASAQVASSSSKVVQKRVTPTGQYQMNSFTPMTGDAATDEKIKVLQKEMESKIKVIRDEYQAKMKVVIGNKKIINLPTRVSTSTRNGTEGNMNRGRGVMSTSTVRGQMGDGRQYADGQMMRVAPTRQVGNDPVPVKHENRENVVPVVPVSAVMNSPSSMPQAQGGLKGVFGRIFK